MGRDTSFYYAFLMLPPAKRNAIVAVWDFCRAVDDAVDEVAPDGEWPLTEAARLQAEASPGQVLAGTATVASLAGAIVTRPVGPLSLKGKSDTVEAFELV